MHSSSGRGGGPEPLEDKAARRVAEEKARQAALNRSNGTCLRGSYKDQRWASLMTLRTPRLQDTEAETAGAGE